MGKARQSRQRGAGPPSGRNQRNDLRERQHGTEGQAQDVANATPAPYHYVAVVPDHTLHAVPVFHDQRGDESCWSGELHCTMTALTPVIAGNYQFDHGQASEDLKQQFGQLLEWLGAPGIVEDKKKILEPLRSPDNYGGVDRNVLIPGQAIKGAIRGSLQALLCAPIERIQERSFSYRPNLQTLTPKHKPIRDSVPALVISTAGAPPSVSVWLLAELRDVCYVHPAAVAHLPQRIQDLLQKRPDELAAIYQTARSRDALRLTDQEARQLGSRLGLTMGQILTLGPRPGPGPASLANRLPVVNLNGSDLDGALNAMFYQKNPDELLATKSRDGYPLLFLKLPERAQSRQLDARLVSSYYESLRHICDDATGHLRDHPLVESPRDVRAIRERLNAFLKQGLRPGHLVFIERFRAKPNAQPQLVSLGHHFYYRHAYRDSVHLAGDRGEKASDEFSENAHRARLRSVLCPHPLEQKTQEDSRYAGAPQALSAARGLFGYIAEKEYTPVAQAGNRPLSFGIGAENSDFRQMAGRLSINWAVEAASPTGGPRFLNEQHGCLVPLRPLGSPKPSAVETYLSQDGLAGRDDQGTLCTYGDTWWDECAGGLRGRKFYLHQPAAARDPACYELVSKLRSPDWFIGKESQNKLALHSQQAAVARFVSAPGTSFRFTIRFRDLRAWELGTLLFVLCADHSAIEEFLLALDVDSPELQKWLNRAAGWLEGSPGAPLLALKLGHGRPLGLGSVGISVDAIHRLQIGDNAIPQMAVVYEAAKDTAHKDNVAEDQAGDRGIAGSRPFSELIQALADKLREQLGTGVAQWAKQVLLPWLQVHRFAGRASYDYPRGKDGSGRRSRLIYEYHSEERRKHARGRKLPKGDAPPRPGGLLSLDELDDGEAKR